MKVNVRLFATFRACAPADARDGAFCLDLLPGERIEDLIVRLGLPVQKARQDCIALVNGRHGEPDRRLEEGDTVSIFPPVAGG